MALTKVSYSMIQGIPLNVLDYGAKGDGVTDDTAAIQAAIDACSGESNQVVFPYGTYKITTSLNLRKKSVSLIGQGYLQAAPLITGDFDDYLIDASGTAVEDYSRYMLIEGLRLFNPNNGSALASCGGVDFRFAALATIRNCQIQTHGVGIYMQESISCMFENVEVYGDARQNPNPYNRGYYGFGRGCRVINGRAGNCFIAMDVSGDSWVVQGLDAESNQIAFRTGAVATFLAEGCHFETTGCLWTNALVLPTIPAYPSTDAWLDNGGNGAGWLDSITFLNCYGAMGSPTNYGLRAPLLVLKTYPGFAQSINMIGCGWLSDSADFLTLSQSFNWTTVPYTAPSGLDMYVEGSPNFKNPTVITVDTGSFYANLKRQAIMKGVANITGTTADNYISLTSAGPVISGNNYSRLVSVGDSRGAEYYGTVLRSAFQPTEDATITLGQSDRRWTVVYAQTGTINTSDGNEKQQVKELTLAEKAVAAKVKLLIRSFKFNDAVAKKGENARIHFGVIAQDVKAAFESEGLDANKYAMFCSDVLEDGSVRLGIRYEELLAFVIAAL